MYIQVSRKPARVQSDVLGFYAVVAPGELLCACMAYLYSGSSTPNT